MTLICGILNLTVTPCVPDKTGIFVQVKHVADFRSFSIAYDRIKIILIPPLAPL